MVCEHTIYIHNIIQYTNICTIYIICQHIQYIYNTIYRYIYYIIFQVLVHSQAVSGCQLCDGTNYGRDHTPRGPGPLTLCLSPRFAEPRSDSNSGRQDHNFRPTSCPITSAGSGRAAEGICDVTKEGRKP